MSEETANQYQVMIKAFEEKFAMNIYRLLIITSLVLVASLVTTGVVIARGLATPSSAPPAALPLGTAFTYQGQLKQLGNPANGSFDFEVKLFDSVTDGSQIGGTVAKQDVSVADGLFTVQLDFGSDAFTGDARWLEIGVRGGSETGDFTLLAPRQELTPTPYAIFATNAWSITGNSGKPNSVQRRIKLSRISSLTIVKITSPGSSLISSTRRST